MLMKKEITGNSKNWAMKVPLELIEGSFYY